jgi:BolA family transcriptional regulator, general stress-responsive regulator|tara:strand:+ start:10246 stop:10494 length:249 start_codon:yes stop_codon:yes gene_type:complete
MEEIIAKKLEKTLTPSYLKITNNSYLHQNHQGHNKSGQTHFKVEIKSEKLEHLKKINAHRMINNILQEEFNSGLHALEIKLI